MTLICRRITAVQVDIEPFPFRTELTVKSVEIWNGRYAVVFRCRHCNHLLCEAIEPGGHYIIKCGCNVRNVVRG